jgi:hypothetical protein
MRTATFLIVLLLARLCVAVEPTPAQVAAMFKEGEKQRPARIQMAHSNIAKLEQLLDATKRGVRFVDRPAGGNLIWKDEVPFESDLQRKRMEQNYAGQIAAAKASLKALEDRSKPVIPEIIDSLDVGKIGLLSGGAKVRSRQSEKECLALVAIGNRNVAAFINGVDCSDDSLVDGRLKLSGTFMVTGTQMISNRPDSEEFLIEPVDVSQYKASYHAPQNDPESIEAPKPIRRRPLNPRAFKPGQPTFMSP